MAKVLVIGGCGRIGTAIARDVLAHTDAEVIITGRNPQSVAAAVERLDAKAQSQILDIGNQTQLQAAIAPVDIVVHAAGPFHYRDTSVLQSCIQQGVNYIDVSDERSFTQKALALHQDAEAAGVTAIVNTGVFPGISNSMVRKGVEAFDPLPDSIQLSYIVAGSGGAGVTVMRTTFIGLQRPFEAWLDGQWQMVKPYSDRETLTFPPPYGPSPVYWYDMPEATTLQQTFPVNSVITKFGIVPDFYNHATWSMAHWLPSAVLQNRNTVEFLAQVSHWMTDITDRFSGTGVAMRCDVKGQHEGQSAHYMSSFVHESAAVAAGLGTGGVVELLLSGELQQPGVYPPEQALPTELFMTAMTSRDLRIQEAMTLPDIKV
ncbi:saccharopine dehydrogenase NADP-binding domain-containing protein [Oscillatoria sp. CS-180]|uniref:saccharopine dehydrogenase family protein n=1 Tax=Oscillatoria sp. CS-180 TaxID=3021720 RepID=UPI00232B1BA3|nr:saccharopine dehydrogenase NADP-binding domain-containing protein [Oscillatoria sp. CS-180]MDB9524986.1 saccharopine dehydrogenase NADP-binding domain-containing protein [Oscillatoria sp. CS-180]